MTKHTPARIRRVAAAARKGLPPAQIAARFGMTPNAVRCLLYKLRKEGAAIPRSPAFQTAGSTTLRLPRATMHGLRAAAKRRGMAPRDLASKIIAATVARKLIPDLVDKGRA